MAEGNKRERKSALKQCLLQKENIHDYEYTFPKCWSPYVSCDWRP